MTFKRTPLNQKALGFATRVHFIQKRKYTGDPYIMHPIAVATLVQDAGCSDEAVAAALMHDCIEDAADPNQALVSMMEQFPPEVVNLVLEVTDVSKPSDGNRGIRKELDRQHLAKASPEGQTIKLADLVDNTSSIMHHDPGFAKIYLTEKAKLLEVLTKGDKKLFVQAQQYIGE